jgi:hypothetical protein
MKWGFNMTYVGRQPVDVSSELLLAESLPVPVTPCHLSFQVLWLFSAKLRAFRPDSKGVRPFVGDNLYSGGVLCGFYFQLLLLSAF